jgi:hypothetical protein
MKCKKLKKKIWDRDGKGWKYDDLEGRVTEALRKKKDIGKREQENGVKVI